MRKSYHLFSEKVYHRIMATLSFIEKFAEKKWGLEQITEILKPYKYTQATIDLVHLYMMGCLVQGVIEKKIPNFPTEGTPEDTERILTTQQIPLQQLTQKYINDCKRGIVEIARIQHLTVEQQIELLQFKSKNYPPS